MKRDDLRPAVRWLGALIGAAALCVLIVSAGWGPDEIAAGRHLAAFGVSLDPCSGCSACGLSRAFAAMTHLRPSEALAFNGAVAWTYPLVLAAALGGPLVALRSPQREE